MARDDAGNLRIRTFGGLSIEREGKVIDAFASRKAEALLVYLACNPRAHPREVLAELLWNERSQGRALANLRVILSSLRKEVGDFVQITRTKASIATDSALALDVTELEAVAARVTTHEGHLSADAVAEASAVLDAYQGDFLQGFFIPDASGFESWALQERVRLQRLVVDALLALGNWRLSQQDIAGAIRSASRLLEIDPLAEPGYRQLMEALARAGRRAEALIQFDHLAEILDEELGVKPDAESQALYKAISAGDFTASQPTVTAAPSAVTTTGSLPTELHPFFGRDVELATLERLILDPTVRLVTVVGPGGIGKTRLALQVARRLAGTYADGATFVDLAPLYAQEAIIPAIAYAIRFDFQSGDRRDPKQQLTSFLRQKQLLLILDNFEHLLEATPLLAEITRAAPGVMLLITSRQRLGSQIEHVYPLSGLALSRFETVVQARKDPLLQLFVYHARRVRPSFHLRDDHLDPLADIFRLTGGMPLAVILAAAWAEVLGPAEIVAEIRRNMNALTAADRDMPERHQSVRAIFDGTWLRLRPEEQRLYAALSVFRGGFSLAAAQDVAGASPRDLMRLVQRSLLSRVANGRFEQHELLRQYAAQELARNAHEEYLLCSQHSAYYCRFLAEREPDLKGPRALETEALIALDYENVRAGWEWAMRYPHDGPLEEASRCLGAYIVRRVLERDGVILFRQAYETAVETSTFSPKLRAALLSWQSYLLTLCNLDSEQWGDQEAKRLARQAMSCLDEAIETGDDVRAERALALLALGLSFANLDKRRNAVDCLKQSIALFGELEMHWESGLVHLHLTWLYLVLAEYRLRHEHFLEARYHFEMVGDERFGSELKISLGANMILMGQFEEGEATLREGLAWIRENGLPYSQAYAWMKLGEMLIYCGQFQEALTALATSRPVPESSHDDFKFMFDLWARMHLGHYTHVEQALKPFLATSKRRKVPYHIGFSNLLLGFTTLALMRPNTAGRYLHESVAVFQSLEQRDELGWAKAGLGYAALQRGERDKARDYLGHACEIALQHELLWPGLMALPAVALLFFEGGAAERAVNIHLLANKFGFVANSRWFKDVAGHHVAALAETVEPSQTGIWNQSELQNFWQAMEGVLRELRNL